MEETDNCPFLCLFFLIYLLCALIIEPEEEIIVETAVHYRPVFVIFFLIGEYILFIVFK